jgi:hypothetical protein
VVYKTKFGYVAKMEEEEAREKQWSWKKIWELNIPLNTRIFMWLAWSNKILTWDNGYKRNWHGLGMFFFLCKSNEELVNHLFVHCHYAREVWFEALLLSNGNNKWEKDSLLSCFKSLYKDKFVKARKALPVFYYGIFISLETI